MATHQSLEPAPGTIETERLLLRPYQAGDGVALLEAIEESRVEMDAWLSWPRNIKTAEDAEDLCLRRHADWIRRNDLTYAMFLHETGRYLGSLGLHEPNWTDRTFEMGYFLRSSATGNGYMTEAVKTLTQMALTALSANRVDLWGEVRNLASIRVAERSGFVYEGTLRNVEIGLDGSLRDYAIYSTIPTKGSDA
ncbi:MAG: GNAT family N-acetyltransferase [Thermomicrobiales bacterium]